VSFGFGVYALFLRVPPPAQSKKFYPAKKCDNRPMPFIAKNTLYRINEHFNKQVLAQSA